jgi:hypothetical protein
VPMIAHYDVRHDEQSQTVSTMLILWDGAQLIDSDAGFAGNDELARELLGFTPTRRIPDSPDSPAELLPEPAAPAPAPAPPRADMSDISDMSGASLRSGAEFLLEVCQVGDGGAAAAADRGADHQVVRQSLFTRGAQVSPIANDRYAMGGRPRDLDHGAIIGRLLIQAGDHQSRLVGNGVEVVFTQVKPRHSPHVNCPGINYRYIFTNKRKQSSVIEFLGRISESIRARHVTRGFRAGHGAQPMGYATRRVA